MNTKNYIKRILKQKKQRDSEESKATYTYKECISNLVDIITKDILKIKTPYQVDDNFIIYPFIGNEDKLPHILFEHYESSIEDNIISLSISNIEERPYVLTLDVMKKIEKFFGDFVVIKFEDDRRYSYKFKIAIQKVDKNNNTNTPNISCDYDHNRLIPVDPLLKGLREDFYNFFKEKNYTSTFPDSPLLTIDTKFIDEFIHVSIFLQYARYTLNIPFIEKIKEQYGDIEISRYGYATNCTLEFNIKEGD